MTELHNWHRTTPDLLFQALPRASNFTQRSSAIESSICKFSFDGLRRCRIWSSHWLLLPWASKHRCGCVAVVVQRVAGFILQA